MRQDQVKLGSKGAVTCLRWTGPLCMLPRRSAMQAAQARTAALSSPAARTNVALHGKFVGQPVACLQQCQARLHIQPTKNSLGGAHASGTNLASRCAVLVLVGQ